MAESILLIVAAGYALFVLLFLLPVRIRKIDAKMDRLQEQLTRMEAKLQNKN